VGPGTPSPTAYNVAKNSSKTQIFSATRAVAGSPVEGHLLFFSAIKEMERQPTTAPKETSMWSRSEPAWDKSVEQPDPRSNDGARFARHLRESLFGNTEEQDKSNHSRRYQTTDSFSIYDD